MAGLIVVLVLLAIGWFVLSAVLKIAFTLIGFLFLALGWIFIGWLAGQLLRGKGYGPLQDAILGLGGGLVGAILFGLLGIGTNGIIMSIISGVVGAVIVVYGVRFFTDNKQFGK